MTPTLVFDLETLPDIDGLRKLNGWGADVPDAEVAERAFAARREAVGHDFLPLHLQRIAVIGCVFRDDQGFRVKTLGQPDDPEAALIGGFFKTIERYTPRLVSWNGSGFDLPVLHYRSLIHGVPAPRYWDTGDEDREFKFNNYISRYHNRHIDLMDLLAKYNGRANAPLDELAKLCGFPGKLGMDGGQVWPAWQAGRADEVRAYCETDVVNTWLVYCRFRFLRGELDAASYQAEIDLVRDTLAASNAPHWQEYLAAWDATA
ncbi:3'-5' exonuclease [Bordetella genomosp. 4]|uniref:3'-5' exonuclease n=1 Tax=Bordetella genomosp. 4 TaxID=463044 RepID=A0A261U3S2_9BORD|nr:3'-5' exonuclease [Bordetella genomosp. 4]OZI49759.1 3'-5' exonuclease [Bordetella genomosp. 4]OZI56201.1 3'-5' exonuclease [Bordetella genomosp. 4]